MLLLLIFTEIKTYDITFLKQSPLSPQHDSVLYHYLKNTHLT